MKIIFFGTPDYVLPVLEALHKEYDKAIEKSLVAVVTQPPQKVGREQKIERSAVDNWAYKHKIDVLYDFDKVPDADLGVVAAYGKIIPKYIIQNTKYGILNIHPSLLPKYRGASPIQAAIAAGDTQTGVSIIKMDEQMDHGPVVSQFKEEVQVQDTNETLRKRLFERSAEFLINLIPNYLSGKIKLKPQNHDQATFTQLVTKNDGFVANPFADPVKTERLFRAMQPWPGIWTDLVISSESGVNSKKRLKILKLHLEPNTVHSSLFTNLILDQVQLEGKNSVTWEQFTQGHPDYTLE